MTRRLAIEWQAGDKVPGLLTLPAGHSGTGILLAHGAGAGQRHPFMAGMRERLAAAGHPVLTFDYPYIAAGRRRPDRPEALLACHGAAAERLHDYVDRVVFAGKSMGGRMASHSAAERGGAAALVFYGYPLVAMGKTEPRDTTHLDRIDAPMLFLAGTRDRMCPLPALLEVADRVGAEVAIVEDAGHSFDVPRRTGLTAADVLDALAGFTVAFLREVLG